MTQNKIKAVLAMLAIGGAFAWLYLFYNPLTPGIDHQPHEALGEVLAQETIKLLGTGGKVIIISRDTHTFPNPASDTQLKRFEQVLKKGGVKAGTLHLLKMNPIGLMMVPPGDFLEIIKKGSDADVIVSFLGPPVLSDEQIAKLGNKRPKIIAVCSGEMPARINLKQMFDEKLLRAAVLSRKNPPARSAGSSSRDHFEQWFWLATPANVAELPMPTVSGARKN